CPRRRKGGKPSPKRPCDRHSRAEVLVKLSRASSYALHALEYLAARGQDALVTSLHIARARGIPELYMRKLLKPLVSARVLQSAKGPNGGYRLARPASKITMLEGVEAVDRPVPGEVPPVQEA